MRLAEWPRDPYLNEEIREWIALHLSTLGASDVAVFATTTGSDGDERRVLVACEVGLLDTWYAPRGSTARYGLSVRLYPWQSVHGVDLRAETLRLWAREHESRWRLRLERPAFDALATTPELGHALAQFAAACAVMAEPINEVRPSVETRATEPRDRVTARPAAINADATAQEHPRATEPPASESPSAADAESPAAPEAQSGNGLADDAAGEAASETRPAEELRSAGPGAEPRRTPEAFPAPSGGSSSGSGGNGTRTVADRLRELLPDLVAPGSGTAPPPTSAPTQRPDLRAFAVEPEPEPETSDDAAEADTEPPLDLERRLGVRPRD